MTADELGEALGRVVGLIFFSACILIYEGYAITLLWRWHIQPLGAPPLTVSHAIGIICIADMFGKYKAEKREATEVIAASLIVITILLGIGWLAK